MRTRHALSLTLAIACATGTVPAFAEDEKSIPETLQDLEREADILSEQARDAIETLLPMIESMMERLPLLIESLPEYEAPKIMPNGDIIIRRKRKLPRIPDDKPGKKGGIKT